MTQRIILPSNSSSTYFPDNTIGTFTSQLPYSLNLEGQWECGLAEIEYTNSWKNVFNAWIQLNIITKPKRKIVSKRVTLQDGYYDDIQRLIKQIQLALRKEGLNEYLDIRFDHLKHKIAIKPISIDGNIVVNLELSENLRTILGCENGTHDKPFTLHTSTFTFGNQPVDMNNGFYSIYVYCDWVQSTIVGDTEAPLLRIIPVQGKRNEQQLISFNRIQYIPLSRKNTTAISVYLRRDNGEIIPFECGKTVVTLLLRRVKH